MERQEHRKDCIGRLYFCGQGGEDSKRVVLVVENFDRFSRLKPRKVYDKVAEVIEAGRGQRDVGRWKISHEGNH